MTWDLLQPGVTFLGQSALGQWLGQSTARIAWLLTFHLLGITLLLGVVIISSLHLLGLVFRTIPTPQVKRNLVPVMVLGLVLALTSGILTFIGGAQGYFEGDWFRTKMQILVVALLFHGTVFRMVMGREHGGWVVRALTGVVALALWFGVAFSGRAIAFF